MSQPFQLQKLQQIDNQIQENKSQLGEILRAKMEPKPLTELRLVVQKLEESIRGLKRQLKDEELTLGTVSDKLNQSQQQLYSGQVKNPKALQDLELESQSLTRRQTDLEDQMLETMTTLEDHEHEYADKSHTLADEQAAWDALLAQLEKDQARVANRLNGLLKSRQEQTSRIEANHLRAYESLLKSKNGLAVSQVVNGICQGCQVTLNQAILLSLKRGEMTKCPTCYRILYQN